MSKTKKLLIALMLLIAILLIPNMVNAAVEYTRSFPSDNGTVKLHFTGLNLEQGKVYKYAIVRQNVAPTEWFSLDDGYTTETATITLSPSESKIKNILKATDTAYIYIKGENDAVENSAVNAYEVSLKLPYLQSLQYTKTSTAYDIYTIIYGEIGASHDWNDKVHWQIQEVTDRDFINKFLENKNDVLRLEEYLPNPPTSGGYSSEGCPKFEDMNDGLYLVWVYRVGTTDCKTIYSCIIHDGLPNATTVEEYLGTVESDTAVVSISLPATKTVKLGETLTLTPAFNPTTATNKIVTWGSSDETVATVDNAGKITPKKVGSTIITVTSQDGNKKATCTVTVTANTTNEEQKKYISFPFMLYFGTTTIDLKQGVYDGDYTMYYQFVEVTNENEGTKYDDTKWIETKDRKIAAPSVEFTGEKKFDLWIKLVMEDETVYESYRYKLDGSTPVTDKPEEQEKPTTTDKDTAKDNTTAKDNLPDTGRVLLFWIIGIVAVSGIVAHIRYKKLYM